jgi:hypothetical protein
MGNDIAATSNSEMQGVVDSIEEKLFPKSQESEQEEGEEVLEDDENLPEGDDADPDEGEDSDLEKIADGEDLSLADYLGIEEDRITQAEDGSYVFNAIIDGETKQVPLKELVANFQLQGHVNNKSIALENERKELQEVKNRVAQELTQRIDGAAKLSELAEQELIAEYKSIDWNTLRYQDPANWTALRQEYAERAQKIQQVQNLVGEERNRIVQEQQQQFAEQAQKHLQEQHALLIKDNPTWADPAVKAKEAGEIRSFLTQYGFTEQDAQGISDHRLIRLIKDAQAFKKGTKAAVEKRVDKKLPKFIKPGSGRENSQSLVKARAAKALKVKVKETGHIDDVAKLIENRM